MQDKGIVHVNITGDQALGRRLIPAARSRLEKLQRMLASGEIDSGASHGPLGDAGYCYVRVAGEINVIDIVVYEEPGDDQEIAEARKFFYPDFLSGGILNGRSVDGELQSWKPTAKCADLHGLPHARQVSKRLNVMPHPALEDFLTTPTDNPPATQYQRLRSTLYSGTMKKLIQFIMGYGKIPEETIYGKQITFSADGAEIEPETPFQQMLRQEGLQVAFDFRFGRTHGLTKATDGKWWITQIRNDYGVHVMPLFLYPETTKPEFRDVLEEKGDTDGIAILDLFGGFPTGESFPTNRDYFNAMVRAGYIVEVADASSLAPFYECIQYSSAMGWAFSDSGHEAHNTAYTFDIDGIQRGVHWNVAIKITDTKEIDPEPGAVALKEKLKRARGVTKARRRAILLKPDRMSKSQIEAALRLGDEESVEYVDALEMERLADVVGGVGVVGEGNLFWPSRNGPQFKIYEPSFGDLRPHDLRPALALDGGGRRSASTIFCDTTVLVFFVGDSLVYAKYYKGPISNITTSGEDSEECKYSGSWKGFNISGNTGVPAMFYTNWIDRREEFSSTSSESTLSSVDLGYVVCQYGDVPSAPYLSFIVRTKAFAQTNVTVSYENRFLETAIAFPALCREAYYHAWRVIEVGSIRSVLRNYAFLGDPRSYVGWRNLAGWTAASTHPAGCGKSSLRKIWYEVYSPTKCSQFADEGSWGVPCQAMEPMAYSYPLVPLQSDPGTRETKASFRLDLVTNTDNPNIKVQEEFRSGEDAVFLQDGWFNPPEFGGQYIMACWSALGNQSYLMHSDRLDGSVVVQYGVPDEEFRGLTPNYIGVING